MAVCLAERNRLNEAKEDLDKAHEDYKEAMEEALDAGGFIDDSTAMDALAVGGAIATCGSKSGSLPGWAVCGLGVSVGVGLIALSEWARSEEVDKAREDLADARDEFWTANSRYWARYDEALECLSCELSKIHIPD